MAWYDEILGDQEGDYDFSGSFGNVSNLFGGPEVQNLLDLNALQSIGGDIFDFIGDQAGDFDLTGSFGDVTKLFDLPDVQNLLDLNALQSLGGDITDFIGDQAGDFDLTGSYGDPLAKGLQGSIDSLFTINSAISQGGELVMGDDGSYNVIDPITGKVIAGADTEGNIYRVGEDGKATYVETGAGLGGKPELNFGGKRADKADVDKLFKENVSVASGKFPGSTTKTNSRVLEKLLGDKLGGGSGKNANAALLAALLGGLLGLATKPKTAGGPRGFQSKTGGAPLTATRQALAPAGAPGSGGGRRFMSDVTFAAEGGLMDEVGYQPNQSVLFMKSGGIADLAEYIKMGAGMNAGDLRKADFLVRSGMSPDSAKDGISKVPDGMARGGLSDLGSYSDGGRMLKGPGDGMSDDIPATIGGKRPARLADGEFVVPADVVSHLGNGSTDAGADVLYDMMDKVRKARTGTKQQGKQINPKKYVPK